MVLLIAQKLDKREAIAAQFFQTPADQWWQQRTLKDIDRDVVVGLDQLLLTPNARRRAGIEIADSDNPQRARTIAGTEAWGDYSRGIRSTRDLRNSAGV
jgi:hypothetical protein